MRTCDIVGPVHIIEIRSISRDEHHAASLLDSEAQG